ncbi:MAG: radical SAM protein [bacterium]
MSLKVKEIFKSIQGESTYVGLPCVFVRLAGCNLRCAYCDTPYAWEGGRDTEIGDVLKRVGESCARLVEITGGEPLLQRETPELARLLCEAGYTVLVETNGSLDISVLDKRVVRIMDLKCPSSGESEKMLLDNVDHLTAMDQVKFVIASRGDYDWAKDRILGLGLQGKCEMLLSAAFGRIEPREIVAWMLRDDLKARFQLQAHKYAWPPGARGV